MRFMTSLALSGSLQKSSARERASSSATVRRLVASSKTHLERAQALAGPVDGGCLRVGHGSAVLRRPISPYPGFGVPGRKTAAVNILLRPAAVFDGEQRRAGWSVLIEGERIVAGRPPDRGAAGDA
jgi:hypothetical protein